MKENLQDKRTLVLEATLDLIANEGFYGASMSQIAKKAKVAVGTIYLYFSNKEELINSLYIEVKKKLASYILKDYSIDIAVKDNFLSLLNNIVSYFKENSRELIFMEQYASSTLITVNSKNEGIDIFKNVREILIRGKEEELIKNLPVEVLIAMVNGLILSIVKFYLSNDVDFNEITLTETLDAIWDTVKK